jgi:acetyl esterase
MLTRDGMRWFTNHYLKSPAEATDWRASPLRAPSLAGVANALVITAGFDPLRDEGAAYAARLTDAGVQVDYINYGGMIHGFMPMGKLIATGNRATSHVAASLRQALR